MSEQELWQLTTNDRIAIGKAASFLRFQAAYSVDATESARQEWRSIAEALTDIERRCQPQPSEDPDEWVVQDRVPVRVGIDMISWHGDVPHLYMIAPTKDGASSGRMHGSAHPWNTNEKLRVWCRRRDLPKVEQDEQWPKYWTTVDHDGEVAFVKQVSEISFSIVLKDGTESTGYRWRVSDETNRKQLTEAEAMALLKKPEPQPQKTDYLHDWSYHNQQKPQPKKTMLRLWVDSDCNVHAGLKGDRDLELFYDHETRQFYTEETR